MEKSQCSSCRQKNNNKKNNKQELKNYRPISLLTVSGKIFERFLYDSMFTFFTKNSLTSQNQTRFKPGGSCTKQLLPIRHQISKSFDDSHEVLSVCLDIPKGFDKLWRQGLISKLKQNGGLGNVLSTLRGPGREWHVIACAQAHKRHILFSRAIIARLNFVEIIFRRAMIAHLGLLKDKIAGEKYSFQIKSNLL